MGVFAIAVASTTHAQKITGKVTTPQGKPIPSVSVTCNDGSGEVVITDANGVFSLNGLTGDTFTFFSSDGKEKKVKINDDVIHVVLSSDDDLVNRGFGVQARRQTSTAAISEVGADKLNQFNSVNAANALYGTLSGLTALTNGGGVTTGASLYLRGSSGALVYIDGIQRPLNAISIDEIEKVTVLKDAAALALYGIQGANGVILVQTKRGSFGKLNVTASYRHGFTTPIRLPQMANASQYAMSVNEALRNDGMPERYTQSEIQKFGDGSDPYNYPNVNWCEEILNDHGSSDEVNLEFQGGGNRVRYYSALHYNIDNAISKNLPGSEKNTRPSYYRLNIRTNLDIKVTQTTQAKINLFGVLDEFNTPVRGLGNIINDAISIPASAFPIKTELGNWGGNLLYTTRNPYAESVDMGFSRSHRRNISADLTINQDLSIITKGLSAELTVAYDNDATLLDQHSKTFNYETNGRLYGSSTALKYASSLNTIYMRSFLSGRLNYNTIIGDEHSLNANLLYKQETWKVAARNNRDAFVDFMGTINYGYSNRYFVDFTAAYSGSSYLLKGDKFRFYPTVSAAWVISNENFWDVQSIGQLKLRASFGQVGNGNMTYELAKQYYNNAGNYYFGSTNVAMGTIKEGALAALGLCPVTATKANVGVDASFFSDRLMLNADFYYDRRTGIQTANNANYSAVLGIAPPLTFDGVVENKGVDISLRFADNVGGFSYEIGGIFSFVKNKLVEDNVKNVPYDYLKKTGKPQNQFFGLQADGFFNSFEEINNHPIRQSFSELRPGDVKYVDQNNDKVIDENDMVAMGYSTQIPEINYGLTLGAEYKGIGLTAIFQGIENISTLLNTPSVYWSLRNDANISEWSMSNNHWSETNKTGAQYPRLTTQNNDNNFRANSIWLADASYFKLRALSVYYNLPKTWVKKMRMDNVKLYVSGNDLFSLDHIKNSDPESIGLGIPTLSSYHLGITIDF